MCVCARDDVVVNDVDRRLSEVPGRRGGASILIVVVDLVADG